MPELTIRGTAAGETSHKCIIYRIIGLPSLRAARVPATENVTLELDHNGESKREEPQASTSAVTLDDSEVDSGITNSNIGNGPPPQPSKPWGLAEYGIPPPPADLQPDPAVEVSIFLRCGRTYIACLPKY